MRRMLLVLLAIAANGFVSQAVFAEHHHKQWFKHFSGDWDYEITPAGLKGTVTYKVVADGNALYAEWKNVDGLSAVELVGWDAHRKMMLINGYGSTEKNYWRLEIDKVTDTSYSGKQRGILPNGDDYECEFEMKKIDDNTCEWNSQGKSSNGTPVKMTGKLTRKR